jgi:hypothetical protein
VREAWLSRATSLMLMFLRLFTARQSTHRTQLPVSLKLSGSTIESAAFSGFSIAVPNWY